MSRGVDRAGPAGRARRPAGRHRRRPGPAGGAARDRGRAGRRRRPVGGAGPARARPGRAGAGPAGRGDPVAARGGPGGRAGRRAARRGRGPGQPGVRAVRARPHRRRAAPARPGRRGAARAGRRPPMLMQRGLVLWRCGRTDEALEAYRRALPTLRRGPDRLMEAGCYNNRSLVYIDRGELAAAEADLLRVAALARAEGQDVMAADAETNLGYRQPSPRRRAGRARLPRLGRGHVPGAGGAPARAAADPRRAAAVGGRVRRGAADRGAGDRAVRPRPAGGRCWPRRSCCCPRRSWPATT